MATSCATPTDITHIVGFASRFRPCRSDRRTHSERTEEGQRMMNETSAGRGLCRDVCVGLSEFFIGRDYCWLWEGLTAEITHHTSHHTKNNLRLTPAPAAANFLTCLAHPLPPYHHHQQQRTTQQHQSSHRVHLTVNFHWAIARNCSLVF